MRVLMKGFEQPVSKIYHGWNLGLKRLGDKYVTIPNSIRYPFKDNADCYYQTNLLKHKHLVGNRRDLVGNHLLFIANSGKPFIVSESNPFREYPGWVRFGWHSYRWDDGNFNNQSVTSDRWNKFVKTTNISIKDWHSPGDKIIIMCQKEGDSSLLKLYARGYESFYQWVIETIQTLRQHTDRPIVIRPHPRNLDRGVAITKKIISQCGFTNVSMSENLTVGEFVNQGGEALEQDFKQAYAVITYNSLSGVEAVCRGIPTFALDSGSMVWPITHHDLDKIENLDYTIDRTEWQNKIAYTMWDRSEVELGEAWAHLKPVYFSFN